MLKIFKQVRRHRQDGSTAQQPAPEVDRSSLADFVRALERADEDDRKQRTAGDDTR